MSNTQHEYKLQVHIFEMHQRYFPTVMFHHNVMEGRDSADIFFARKKGARKGISDITIWWRTDSHKWELKCAMIEVKYGDNRLSPDQNKFISAFKHLGGYTGVVRSWSQYYKLLCFWGIKPKEICQTFIEPVYATQKEKFDTVHEMYAPCDVEP